jgi:predicted HAD superfamily Cof-like phosphohydrolase
LNLSPAETGDFDLWQGQSPLDQVADFHHTFSHPIATEVISADALATDLAFARMDFMQEEMDEMWEAIRNNDPVEFTDAVVDLLYFLYGTALALGIPLELAFNEVHGTNMAKANPDGSVNRREDGKILKPEGWVAPNLAAVLAYARAAGTPFVQADEGTA